MGEKLRQFRAKIAPFVYIFFFSVLIFYYESVFKASTTKGYFGLGTLYTFLFSFIYGSIVYLLVSLIKVRRIARILTGVLMILFAVPYLVEYFVYRQFKIFYDVNTVFAGAGDAMTSFYDVALQLVFSLDGIFKLVLYFLPAILYFVFSNRIFPTSSSNMLRRLIAGGTSVLCLLLAVLMLFLDTARLTLVTKEYNYQSAVHEFGLTTGTYLDIYNIMLGGKNDEFEMGSGPVIITPTPDNITLPPDATPTPTPKVYGFNQMQLDLEGGSGRIADLNKYVSSLTPSRQNEFTGLFKGKNLIMISAEAFTAEVIDPVLTPTLYRLATKGIQFTDYYQPSSAGTTGGEYQNVFSMMPTAGGKSFKNTATHLNYFTMGSQLNRLNYYGKAYHNNSYTFYSRNETHNNLGYSDGFMGYGNGMEAYVKNVWPQSDLEMLEGTLPTYIDRQPFNVYYMTVSGHSGYTRTGNTMTKRNWDVVKDLPYSDAVKGYLAANYELEKAMAYLVKTLEEKGIADDTVICLSTDHFPYGLDSAGTLGNMPYLSELYGYQVNDLFQRDHSRLILWSGCVEKMEPIVVSTPTSSLDIVPTLSNLFGTEYDSRLFVGRDVFSDQQALVFNSNYDWKTAYGTYVSGKFTQTDMSVTLPDNYVEQMKTVVRNKMRYCQWVLENDYFRHLFG